LQQQDRVKKLVEWFVRAALRHAEAMEAMHEERAAIEVESLTRFYTALQREGGMGQFLALLDHDDPNVAGMAAVYAMREEPQRCKAALTRIAALPGLLGFRAQTALERWERGEWQG